jgi:arylformamidase
MPLSVSEKLVARFRAESLLADPVDALREALFGIGKQMGGEGYGPPHLVSMLWESADPDALDPARIPVDLAYRDVFVGFRPPIIRKLVARPGVSVEVECARPAAPAPEEISALERAYSARRGVDMQAVLGQWRAEGREARQQRLAAGRARLDLAFGIGPFGTLDLFLPAAPGPYPCWIFLHGGYWMATDKTQYAQFAHGMLEAGIAVALPNYPLAPQASLEQQVAECARAVSFLAAEASTLDLDRTQFHLAGHSAGAHLAAMVSVDPTSPPLKSLLLLSGLFDLAPLGSTALGKLLGLDRSDHAARLNPLLRHRPEALTIAQALGAREAEGFFTQAAMLEQGWNVEPAFIAAGANHFSLLEGLKSGPLLDLALKLTR